MLCNLCPIPFHHYGNKICFNHAEISFIDIRYCKLRSKLLATITNVRTPPPFLFLLRKCVPNIQPVYRDWLVWFIKTFFSLRVHMMNKE